jgi:hypothetical protein
MRWVCLWLRLEQPNLRCEWRLGFGKAGLHSRPSAPRPRWLMANRRESEWVHPMSESGPLATMGTPLAECQRLGARIAQHRQSNQRTLRSQILRKRLPGTGGGRRASNLLTIGWRTSQRSKIPLIYNCRRHQLWNFVGQKGVAALNLTAKAMLGLPYTAFNKSGDIPLAGISISPFISSSRL